MKIIVKVGCFMFSFLARDIFMREFLAVMFETSKFTGGYSTLDIIFRIDLP